MNDQEESDQDMTVTYHARTIELETHAQAEFWANELRVSVHELFAALNAVGNGLDDVIAYLNASREPMGAFVDKMRSRLDEIETQFQSLAEERRSIVTFLEGFAQVQRNQRHHRSGEAVMLTVSLKNHASPEPADLMRRAADPMQSAHRSISPGSSVAIVEVVHRLLSDGKRRSLQEILAFLEVRGVPLKGANRAGFLSTLLSRDPRFDASRREGWGCLVKTEEENPASLRAKPG